MKYLLILSCLLFTSVGWSKTINGDDLIKSNQDGLYYERFTDKPFTGKTTGQVQQEFRNGVLHGEAKAYYPSGQLLLINYFRNGKKHGENLWYFENGQLQHKQNYKDGKRDGEQLEYYENGQLKYLDIYKDGKFIETIKP